MAYTTPASLSAGNALTATHMNQLRTDFEAVAKPPIIQAHNTASQSIPNNLTTQLTLAGSFVARDATLASNALTVAEAGWYLALLHVSWATNATGLREVRIHLNGNPGRVGQLNSTATNWSEQQVTHVLSLAPTDSVTAFVAQTSGGALNVNIGTQLTLVMLTR